MVHSEAKTGFWYARVIWVVHRLIWIWYQPLFNIFTQQVILNRKKILETKTPLIFVSNHESHFDPFLISGATPCFGHVMPIRFFSRDIFFEQFKYKLFLWLVGAFPGHIGLGLKEATELPARYLNEGYSIGVFPEWCFPDEPEASRMQNAAPAISQESGAPIVPVFLFGIQGLSWSKVFLMKKKIIISFGDPIYPDAKETLENYTERVSHGLLAARFATVQYIRGKEHNFWASYADFYKHLELAAPYQKMTALILGLIAQKNVCGRWLDLGTGSGAMTELVLQAAGKNAIQVLATDFSDKMLDTAKERFKSNPNVTIEKVDLTEHLPYDNGSFDGVVANLVLPYITHHAGVLGKEALANAILQVHRVLKPGGFFLFSTPKPHVNFIYVALASWKSFFRRDHPEYRRLALHILRHALRIQKWGRREIYNFLSLSDLEDLFYEVGFVNLQFKLTLSDQVYVVTGEKVTSS
ncbi:MAG: methyltransferase domain-containing protein [Candidatus Sungbacteria bacterium]|uniref:Methyltransferase domain-containing protein n=1 Tax=Candidatus Sungiibacteriota bacterium TaxID=2750080 RepID=A0A9D6QRT6_9BACT|nr:methyltransferase domain-containing protein [Candidatus Sungbacteria bacterium]